MEKKKVIFILNPISGTVSKAGIPKLVEEVLDKEKFDYEIRFTEYAGHASEIAAQARDEGAHIVVAVGGDGTVNEVGRSLINSDTAMAIIPCGSGNGLARHLQLPLQIKKAIQILNSDEIHTLDYGLINNMPFFCTCGMGFDAHISKLFADSGKRGKFSYGELILKEGFKYKAEDYEITLDDGTVIKKKAYVITCANASQYGNNVYIAPTASMSDGLLDIIVMDPFGVIDATEIGIEFFLKTLNTHMKVQTYKGKKVHIHRNQPGVIHYDGDAKETTADVDIEIISKGIKVVVNPNADKSLRRPNALENATTGVLDGFNKMRRNMSYSSRYINVMGKMALRKLRANHK